MQKEPEGCDDDNNQNIHSNKAYMSGNYKSYSRYLGDSSQLTNWILDSGATCHMIP